LLDFNERVIPLPNVVMQKMAEWSPTGQSCVYPEYDGFIEILADYAKVPPESLFFGNGSDQLLDCIFRAVVDPGDKVLLPDPSFAMYPQCAQLTEAQICNYSMLDGDPLENLQNALDDSIRMAVLCQPNNPTGSLIDLLAIKKLIESHPQTWFLIDEAYYEFSKQTLLETNPWPENLVITRTFSKAFGMAALRLGYMRASRDMIEQCGKIRGPYDTNQFAIVAARIALEHREEILAYIDEVMGPSKTELENALKARGIDFIPSFSNFILIPNPPKNLVEKLENAGIRIRRMSQPSLRGACRISIGDLAATEKLVKAL
jgi:histidinol-phosphate aminotransferase